MSALTVYSDYLALKRHFSDEKFDYFKYARLPVTVDSLEKRKDKYYFLKLSKDREYKHFLIANFVKDKDFWIGDMSSQDRIITFQEWNKKIQSLSYTFRNELGNLDEDFNSNFVIKNNQHPNVVKLYLKRKISLETLVILVDITNTFNYNMRKLDDVIWKDVAFKIKKYYPFLSRYYAKEKLKEEVKKYFD